MLPGTAPRFLRLPGDPARYVALETLLARFSPLIFPGYRVKAAAAFRVLRDSDIEFEEEAEDLVRYFANATKRRRRGRRSEERRVGKCCDSTWYSRWAPAH